MKILLFFPAFLWVTSCFSQRQNVYFLKNNGKYLSQRDSADYIRIVREPDSASHLFNIDEFYFNEKRKLVGKSKTIDPPAFEGQCVEYYPSGVKKSVANYHNNSKSGFSYEFYPHGRPYIVKEYANDSITDNYFRTYQIKANYDSLGAVLVEDGNGYAKIYDADFKDVVDEGDVKNGKREGVWKGYFNDPKLSFKENYINGELVSGTAIFEDGIVANYSKSRGTLPKYKTGANAFQRFFNRNFDAPTYEWSHYINGLVVVSFMIDKDGKLSKIEVEKSVSPGLDDAVMVAIEKSPLWIPGTMFGKPARMRLVVPVTITEDY